MAAKDMTDDMSILITNGLLQAEIATIEVEQKVLELRGSGMEDVEIKKLLLKDFVDENPIFFSHFRTSIADMISNAVPESYERSVASAYREAYGVEQRFKWLTHPEEGAGGEVCTDCQLRDGTTRTLEEWERVGLPKSGFSRCRQHCRCEIVPEELVV